MKVNQLKKKLNKPHCCFGMGQDLLNCELLLYNDIFLYIKKIKYFLFGGK
jgi:hypothetical protein